MSSKLIDQLSWEKFYENSKNLSKINKVKDFNRLIAHSKNFFLISGYGAFTSGYVILITKNFIPSYGLVENDKLGELNFIINLIKRNISENLNRKSAIFEHGMCACIGGLDRAHLHIMSVNKLSNEKSLVKAINKSLDKRKFGIKYIEFNNYKLENIHDINQIMDSYKGNKSKNIKIVGKVFKINDIQNLDPNKWPINTLGHINKGGHYVFFSSDYKKANFLTTHNFQTQFGRQVIFENELMVDNSFKNKVHNMLDNNKYLDVWRWQNFKFEDNIIDTVNSTKSKLKRYKTIYKKEFQKYKFEII